MSPLTILFKESHVMALRRLEQYGVTDFIGNCGGILGLFLGVSLLSIFEIIYYATIRLICIIRIRRGANERQSIALAARLNPNSSI